jgi:hypothetical protein
MRVGITLTIEKNGSLFSNGLVQNCFTLYDVLKEIESVSEVYIINTNYTLTDEELKENSWAKGYDIITWGPKIKDQIDILITVGSVPAEDDLLYFKSGGNKKIISYKCGNTFLIHMEDILFSGKFGNKGETKKHGVITTEVFDEVWMVPQQEFHNKQFFELAHNCESKSVPFVWSPKFINELVPSYIERGITPFFDDKVFDKWKVAAIEPNINMQKTLLPIIYSCEYAYKKNPDAFEEFNITNSSKLIKNKTLIDIVKNFESHKDKKMIFDGRYNIVNVLSKFADMIVCNQWGNALNYAYLDTVYFGSPLIHNAHLCQDIGYYYEDFKIKDAGDLILKVIEERKSDKEYTKRHREILKRYTIENKEMINQYELLLKNLFEKNEIDGKQYDWKTNLLK